MKYRDSAWIAAAVAEAMRDRWEYAGGAAAAAHGGFLRGSGSGGSGALPGEPAAPLVIPVPMAEHKKRRRGYDQAELIARIFARSIGAPFAPDILLRRRETAVMSGLGAESRRANMADAFAVGEYARKLIGGGELALGSVLLIDDVFTTGSTADACAAVLKEAGAEAVTLFTFAAGADGGGAENRN
jgi:predicted amidophosphoribosyltransferase